MLNTRRGVHSAFACSCRRMAVVVIQTMWKLHAALLPKWDRRFSYFPDTAEESEPREVSHRSPKGRLDVRRRTRHEGSATLHSRRSSPTTGRRWWRGWTEGMRNEEMEGVRPGPPPQNALFPLSFTGLLSPPRKQNPHLTAGHRGMATYPEEPGCRRGPFR